MFLQYTKNKWHVRPADDMQPQCKLQDHTYDE